MFCSGPLIVWRENWRTDKQINRDKQAQGTGTKKTALLAKRIFPPSNSTNAATLQLFPPPTHSLFLQAVVPPTIIARKSFPLSHYGVLLYYQVSSPPKPPNPSLLHTLLSIPSPFPTLSSTSLRPLLLIPVSVFAHCSIVSPCGWVQTTTEPSTTLLPSTTLPFQPSELHDSSETLPSHVHTGTQGIGFLCRHSGVVAHNTTETLYKSTCFTEARSTPRPSTLRVAPFLIRSTLGPCQLHNQLFCVLPALLPDILFRIRLDVFAIYNFNYYISNKGQAGIDKWC